ncbi:MAG: ABC transporter ATP-binding protein [Patescibacteria group bacterium]
MNNQRVIKIQNLTKVFAVYKHPLDLLKEVLIHKKYHSDFKALNDVSFELKKGEVVGIIGRNGSGKSTLLKIITGTLDKTSGRIEVKGKISAILELGLGFNPEYSGRENILNGGMVLGMSRQEIIKKMDSIIEFSELEEFIDRPFKTYSSGMQARLTFSVATAVEPEILIIDEALATGDMIFVSKCLEKITQMCRSGATVLFVSHSLPLVQKLCQRAIYLEKGKVIMDGPVFDVCQAYERDMMFEISQRLKKTNRREKKEELGQRIWKNGPIDILEVKVIDKTGKENYSIYQNDKMTIQIIYKTERPLKDVGAWVLFTRSDGVYATSYLSSEFNQNLGEFKKTGKVLITWDPIYLSEGDFLITCGFYPKRKSRIPSTIRTNAYIIHDKCYKLHITRRGWPLQTVYDQPVKIFHRPFQADDHHKKDNQ